jgi:glycosyltransferase involved in cell wall biosynthesis
MSYAPLASIIIPCFNQSNFLLEAVLSVINQSFRNWECIIIDDGSTDNTYQVAMKCCSLDKRVKYNKKENGGLSSARNAGIRIATGDYIQLLDSDDIIEKDKLEKTLSFYKQVPANTILFSGSRYFEDLSRDKLQVLGRSSLIPHVDLNIDDTLETQRTLIRKRNFCVISAPIYPRVIFEKVGFFDEDLKALEDWDFHLRCSTAGYKFNYISIVQGRTLIRLHDASMMRNTLHMIKNQEKFNRKHQVFEIKTNIKKSLVERACLNLAPPFVFKIVPKCKILLAKFLPV